MALCCITSHTYHALPFEFQFAGLHPKPCPELAQASPEVEQPPPPFFAGPAMSWCHCGFRLHGHVVGICGLKLQVHPKCRNAYFFAKRE